MAGDNNCQYCSHERGPTNGRPPPESLTCQHELPEIPKRARSPRMMRHVIKQTYTRASDVPSRESSVVISHSRASGLMGGRRPTRPFMLFRLRCSGLIEAYTLVVRLPPSLRTHLVIMDYMCSISHILMMLVSRDRNVGAEPCLDERGPRGPEISFRPTSPGTLTCIT
jgi:hypothetical protein